MTLKDTWDLEIDSMVALYSATIAALRSATIAALRSASVESLQHFRIKVEMMSITSKAWNLFGNDLEMFPKNWSQKNFRTEIFSET